MREICPPSRVICALAFLSPGLSIYLPLSLAPVVGLAGALIAVHAILYRQPAVRPPLGLVGFLGALAALTVASLLWSYDPPVSQRSLVKFVPTMICGILIVGAALNLGVNDRNLTSRCLLAGLVLAGAIAVVELVAGGVLITLGRQTVDHNHFLNHFSRGLIVCSFLFWPAVDVLVRRRLLWGVCALGLMVGVMINFRSESALVALGAGAVVFGLVRLFPKHLGKGISGAVVILFLCAPLVVKNLPAPRTIADQLSLPNSSFHRLLIWRFTTDHIEERPVLGWGFNTSRVVPGAKELIEGEVALPLHPHNGILQLWLELGVFGGLVGAAFVFWIAERIRKKSADVVAQAIASASLGAATLAYLVSFGAWQTWWLAALIVGAACTTAVCGGRKSG